MKTAKEVLIEHFAKHEGMTIEEATKSLGGDFEELGIIIHAMEEYAQQEVFDFMRWYWDKQGANRHQMLRLPLKELYKLFKNETATS